MCTVVIEVPTDPSAATRVLAVRDEDPNRAWDPPGPWWQSSHPGVIGVRDRRANGAWLTSAAPAGRLTVILNRAAEVTEPATGFTSRGSLVLDSVSGAEIPEPPTTPAFTLVEVAGSRAATVAWDGAALRRDALVPGVHMVAHHEVDDSRSARIAHWLPEFQALAGMPEDAWQSAWLGLLARSAELDPADDRAIIRDNRAHGYPTLSLLACVASVSAEDVDLAWAPLAEPGRWDAPQFRAA